MLRQFILCVLLCSVYTVPAAASQWGLLWPSGHLTDIQSMPHEGREADGQSVQVFGDVPPGPLTYDSQAQAAVPWQAEIDRLAGLEQQTGLDFDRVRQRLADWLDDLALSNTVMGNIRGRMDQIQADAQAGTLTTVAALRVRLVTVSEDMEKLAQAVELSNELDRAELRALARLLGAIDVPAEPTPTPTP